MPESRDTLSGQGVTGGYVAPTCATCNHPVGDHKSSGHASLTVHHGRCLVPGCACTAFTPRDGGAGGKELRDAA